MMIHGLNAAHPLHFLSHFSFHSLVFIWPIGLSFKIFKCLNLKEYSVTHENDVNFKLQC